MKNTPYVIAVVAIILALVVFLFFPSLIPRSNTQLAKYIFRLMMRADNSVVNLIDWEHFTALGADVGADYMRQPDEESRRAYSQAMVRSFSVAAISGGSRETDLGNWREYATSDAGNSVIAADYPRVNQVVLFEIARVDGRRKLVSMSWGREPQGAANEP